MANFAEKTAMATMITSLDCPELAPYAALTEAQLRQEHGLFIAESPKVILTALRAGLEPVSLLCEARHLDGDAAPVLAACPGLPVYTGGRELLRRLTGYTLTRGVLCAMRRPCLPSPRLMLEGARRVAVMQSVTDTTNVGAIFRSAAALGVDAVVVSDDCCDPLNRRAVRVSMGSVFLVPWTRMADPVGQLGELGLKTVALALTHRSVPIDDPRLRAEPRLAMVVGTEGDGLPRQVIERADWTARIPMAHGVDSLNVAAAAAVAFWELRDRAAALSFHQVR